MLEQPPKISVILPVYNAGSFLAEAINSVLNQTFAEFELIIINDGSTDDSVETIAKFKDSRIKVIDQSNKGLRAALNLGILMARGTYIARMDQDDISLSNRFEKQVSFLDAHQNHVLVGTTYAYINEEGKIFGAFPALLDNEDIKRELYTKSPFGHGTVMFRSAALKKGEYTYSQDAIHIEDYELWIRFSVAGKYANLPEILYLWRKSSSNTTSNNFNFQQNKGYELQMKAMDRLGPKPIISWPGSRNLHKYKNTHTEIYGTRVNIRRHDAHCSLYLALSRLFFHRKKFRLAVKSLIYAVLISPLYVASFGWKRSSRYE